MDPNDEVAWFGLGKAYQDDGNHQEAAAALERCIAVKPDYSAAPFAFAESLRPLGQVERCRQVCDLGIAVSTRNGDAMVTQRLQALKQGLG
jgi:tetratricopeptide (TPR) repeat protein